MNPLFSRTIDPSRRFESRGRICPLSFFANTVGVGVNRLIAAAVPDQRIRCMGLAAQTQAAASGNLIFKSASGGTVICPSFYTPVSTNGAFFFLPMTETGYFETNTNEGLYADCGTNDQSLLLFYITYAP